MASTTPINLIARPQTVFDFSAVPAVHTRDNRHISHFYTALSMIAPITEGAGIRIIRRLQDRIDDPRLKREIEAFIKQEGVHTREHRRLNAHIASLGINVDAIVARHMAIVAAKVDSWSPDMALASLGVAEHLICEFGRLILTRPEMLDGMHPEVVALLRWHAIEEIEHQSVANDVYFVLFGGGLRRKWQYTRVLVESWRILSAAVREIFAALMAQDGQQRDADTDRREKRDFLAWLAVRPAVAPQLALSMLHFVRPGMPSWRDAGTDMELIEKNLALLAGSR
ncbi:MAG TPA: metal-dependent hydrolase [Solimonas sp.]|nr:metal-dependent hydrolase [Solimonas sp.]